MGEAERLGVSACLSARAEEIMSTPPLTVDAETPLWDVARRMYESGAGSALVVRGGVVEGIITRRDILYLVATGAAARNPPVSMVMTTSVVHGRPDETVDKLLQRMLDLGIRHIPILDDSGRPLGMVSSWDILNLILKCVKGEWNPKPRREPRPG